MWIIRAVMLDRVESPVLLNTKKYTNKWKSYLNKTNNIREIYLKEWTSTFVYTKPFEIWENCLKKNIWIKLKLMKYLEYID